MSKGAPRVYDLSAARPERWFDEVLKQSPDFERASHLMGRSTLGLALVAGARITSLTPNPEAQQLTMIEFSIGSEGGMQNVRLPEFREIIAQHLLTPLRSASLPEDPDVEALQAHIGGRYMLEASLFQVRPIELRHELGLSEITLEFNGVRHVLALEDFRDVIDERVRAELGLGESQDGVAIDLGLVDQASEANAEGRWTETIALLTPWLTPVSMLLRTGEAQGLGKEAHGRLSEALDLLGNAYANVGDLGAADEVLRLGVQWAGETSKAGDLFLTLGRAAMTSDKYGEAIGLLRRAIRLGAEERRAMPLLATSLAAREQVLAAMVCLRRARSLDAADEASDDLEASLQARLDEPWVRFQGWMSDPE